MTARVRWLVCLGLVALLYAFDVGWKTRQIFSSPTWDARDEVGQFWSEFAFHYRFAKFFAEHPVSDWGQLADDRKVQYPDTMDDWAEFTVAMEVPVGVIYRLGGSLALPMPPFHVFVVWYDCLISSLTLFAVFFLARAVWRSDGAGVLASAFYATLYPSYGRTVKNLFLREDFSIPLIVFALFFSVYALQTAGPPRKIWPQIVAAIFWLAALASWHLTQFVLVVGVGAAVLVYLSRGETPRVPWLVLLLAVGGMLVPVLRAKQFYSSPTMCAVYALSLAVWINGGRRRAGFVFAGWLAVLLGVGALLQKSYGEYAHVYQLFIFKLRFLGVKPADPAQLPWEARCLWEAAFNTATPGEFWHSLEWCLPLGLVGMWHAWRDRDVALRVFALFTLMLVPLSWMVLRYFTFLGFAIAVVAAGLLTRRIWWRTAVLAALVWQVAALHWAPVLSRDPVHPDNYKPLVRWINANTPTNAVFLANISEAPVVLACTGRPIILHSKFENLAIRERYREFLAAIYGTEDQLFAFAKKYGADYLVFDNGFFIDGIESRRYKADKLGDLDPNCAAVLIGTAPDRLRHFVPEFAANGYWVLQVRQ